MEYRQLGGSGFKVPVLSPRHRHVRRLERVLQGLRHERGGRSDALTPVEETLNTLDDLVRAGKLRYVGCSSFSGWHLMKSSGS